MALFTISSSVAWQVIAHRHRFLVTRGRGMNQEMGEEKGVMNMFYLPLNLKSAYLLYAQYLLFLINIISN